MHYVKGLREISDLSSEVTKRCGTLDGMTNREQVRPANNAGCIRDGRGIEKRLLFFGLLHHKEMNERM